MINNTLIKILASFSRKEMTYFEEFVYSPYFNKHEGVRQLVSYLSKIYPAFNEETCHRYTISAEMYPGEAHDQNKIALLFTYTLRLLEKFIGVEKFLTNEKQVNILALSRLRSKKNYDAAQKLLHNLRKKADTGQANSPDYYYLQMLIEEEEDRIMVETNPLKRSSHIEAKQHYLDIFHCIQKLRDSCEMLTRSRILQGNLPDFEADLSFQFAQSFAKKQEEVPAIRIYFLLFEMLKNQVPETYFTLNKFLEMHQDEFPFEELQNIYNYLQNFCISQINLGNELFLRELFNLYKQQLNKDLLFEQGVLNEWHYKNIATVGTRLGETVWVQKFLEEYMPYLKAEIADNAYHFNLASLLYAKGNLQEVLELLLMVEYTDPNYQLESKALLMRTYYDLGEYEPLFSLCDSFRQLLHRNKQLSEARKKGYGNLVRISKKAAQLKYKIGVLKKDEGQKALAKLEKDFIQSGVIFNSAWLKDKITEIRAEL